MWAPAPGAEKDALVAFTVSLVHYGWIQELEERVVTMGGHLEGFAGPF